jgi:hypothetical protein
MGDMFVIRTVNNGEPHYTDAGNDFASAVRQLDAFPWYYAPHILKLVEIDERAWTNLQVTSYNPPWLTSDQP